ncbi:MAG TPA: hypothetical protein VFS15_08780 [Kofleriaceae bacterium]|nr:hypothetical protein [Kofleriaceae bacterium]
MTYRDDRDADQARIAALEAELAETRKKLEELEGKRSQALVLASGGALVPGGKATSGAARWLGAPLQLELVRRFDGEYPTDRFEELVELIREVTRDRGRTELLRSSVAWSASTAGRGTGPHTSITVSVRGGVTTLTATDQLNNAAGGVFGGVGGGVGGGLIMAPIGATLLVPVLAPVFFTVWFGGVYAGARAIFRRVARSRAQRLQRVFDAVERELERVLTERAQHE